MGPPQINGHGELLGVVMVGHRIQAVSEIATGLGAAGVLLSSPAAVRWSGVTCHNEVHVLVIDGEALVIAPAGNRMPPTARVERFVDRSGEAAAAAIRRAFVCAELGPADTLAVELSALPVALTAERDGPTLVDAAATLVAARVRKDPDELKLIGRAAELAAVGQAAARSATRVGVSELELWAAAQAAMHRARGRPVHAEVDLMAAERTALVGRPPSPFVAGTGDPVLFALAPRRSGYWAASCATFSCGAPGGRLKRRHDVVHRALDRGLCATRPGRAACDVDAAMRAVLEGGGLDCPHHTGHGVGTAPQEPPWLIPQDNSPLEEGMVIALAPGAYSGGLGVRLEHLVVIERDGARPLSTHSVELT